MELDHFSHTHPLTFKEVRKSDEAYCSGCMERVLDRSYGCAECNYVLHKECAELPSEINHPMHRRHPLVLEANERLNCDLCQRSGWSFVYYCSLCYFTLDIKCAEVLPRLIEAPSHEHPFTLLCKKISFVCDACGRDGKHSPYVCTLCDLIVHKRCISLPRTIRIIRHDHLMKHTYFLQESESDWRICGICHEGLRAKHGCFHCLTCNYIAHVLCATRPDIWDGSTELLEDEDEETNESVALDSITSVVKEIKLGEELIAAEIKHFSHQHNLNFRNEEEAKDDKRCEGCVLPISGPFYSCIQCDFYLHKTCIELPRKKRYPFHQHTLTLLSRAPESNRIFVCDACSLFSNGFSYNCGRCDFDLDLRCSSMSDTHTHKGHEHPLIAFFNRGALRICRGCGESKIRGLRCDDCDYILDFKCATLPLTAKHKYEKHPLTLTFRDDSDQLDCDICEWERDPDHWFYSSDDFLFTAHPECVLGKYPYIKLGDTYAVDSHSHPLTFVQKTRNYPKCNSCGEPCKDLSLECAESGCSFINHWECVRKN